MGDDYERRRILIWGKTRPEVSQTYGETVCTGGVFGDTKKLVRLYPIRLRYLNDDAKFRKYQWITAEVKRNPKDPRPESYRIRAEGIVPGELIEPATGGNWDARAEWVLDPGNCFASVEALIEAQQQCKTSLGIVKPAEILGIHAVRFSDSDQRVFWDRHKTAVAQLELEFDDGSDPVRPLTPPHYQYKIKFRCADAACSGHDFSVLDWELDAFYAKQVDSHGRQGAAKRVVTKLEEVCDSRKDIRFFLGNIWNFQQTFTIVGLWYPNEKKQLGLF